MPERQRHENRIAYWRENRSHLTQEELAKLMDIDVSTISKHERGLRMPPKETIKRYAEIFKIETHELFLDLQHEEDEEEGSTASAAVA